MRRAWFYIASAILLMIPLKGSCQDTEPPESPLFTGVTVNPSTGYIDMTWLSSTSPDVAGYVVYQYDTLKNEGYYIDTIFNPATLSYSAFRPKTAYESESYVIAAFDNSGNISPLSNRLNTIYSIAMLDSCNKRINLAWNKYPSVPYRVTGYDILISENGGAFVASGHVDANTRSFTIESFTSGSSYCYLIRAVLENSHLSLSSKPCLTARFKVTPRWINADYATVTGTSEIALSFTVDPATETDLYLLEKKIGDQANFSQIAMIRTQLGTITYTDKNADTQMENFYRLSALNICEVKVIASNIASNIRLTNQVIDDRIELKWNNYHNWLGGIANYRLFMKSGNGFNEYADLEATDTTYVIPVSDIISSAASGNICFLITASEDSNPYGITGESSSNESCYEISETITVPNLFTPDGDTKNDLFRPVLTFIPVDYHLIISDRQGRIVFDTRNFYDSWNGTEKGTSLPQGVYIWTLRVKTLSGKNISRTGTITIYRNR